MNQPRLRRSRRLSVASTLLLLGLWCLGSTPSSAQDEQAAGLSDAQLLALAEEARALVAKHYGEPVEALKVPVRVVDEQTVVKTLERDLRPGIVIQFGEEGADELTANTAEAIGAAILARYSFEVGEVLICRENIESLSKALETPRLREAGPLRTLLVHEFVHARDARDVDLPERLGACKSTDELQGLNAVIEGHAQFITRQVVNRQGWQDDFQVFVDCLTKVPPSVTDPAQRALLEMSAASFGFSYIEGERFVAAVSAARGPETLDRLFVEPPLDPGAVLRPEYFLDPSSRPSIETLTEEALDHFEVLVAPEEYVTQRISLVEPQIKAILNGVDPKLVEQALEGLLTSRVLVCQNPDQIGSMLTVTLFEFDSPGAGLVFMRTLRALLKLRDELYKEGPTRITFADYTELSRPDGMKGLLSDKLVSSVAGEQEVLTVLLLRETTLIELSSIDEEDDTDQLIRWSEELLKVAHGLQEPASAEPEGDEPPQDADDEQGAIQR